MTRINGLFRGKEDSKSFHNVEVNIRNKKKNKSYRYSCGIKISGTIFLSLQQDLCKAPSTVIMTDIKSSL
jgi:hypothetical protein